MFAQSTPHAQENQVAVVTMGDTGLLGMLVPHKAAQRAVSKPPAKKARKARSSAPDGVHLVIHVCAPGAMVDFLPDEGCYDSASARDALMASCPLQHGLPLSDVDVDEAFKHFVMLTTRLPAQVRLWRWRQYRAFMFCT